MSVNNTIEWKKATLFIECDPKPYKCFFCKDRIHFDDNIPNKMNRYELELCGGFDITTPRVNIVTRALDKFCGTIFTDYDKSDTVSDILITKEISKGIFLADVSLMDIRNVLNIFDGAVNIA